MLETGKMVNTLHCDKPTCSFRERSGKTEYSWYVLVVLIVPRYRREKLIQESINWFISINEKEQARNLNLELGEKSTVSRLKTAGNKVEKDFEQQKPIRIQYCKKDQIKGVPFSLNTESFKLPLSQKGETEVEGAG